MVQAWCEAGDAGDAGDDPWSPWRVKTIQIRFLFAGWLKKPPEIASGKRLQSFYGKSAF